MNKIKEIRWSNARVSHKDDSMCGHELIEIDGRCFCPVCIELEKEMGKDLKEIDKLKEESIRKDERQKAEKEFLDNDRSVLSKLAIQEGILIGKSLKCKAMIEKIEYVLDHNLTDNQGQAVRQELEKLKGDMKP